MTPEPSLLEAIIIVTCAVIAAGSAMLVVRAADRSRSGWARQREALAGTASRVSRDAARLRDELDQATGTVERMRADGASWDEDIGRVTKSLRAQRAGIERMTRGRLATLIRMAGVVSKAARFAFLWR